MFSLSTNGQSGIPRHQIKSFHNYLRSWFWICHWRLHNTADEGSSLMVNHTTQTQDLEWWRSTTSWFIRVLSWRQLLNYNEWVDFPRLVYIAKLRKVAFCKFCFLFSPEAVWGFHAGLTGNTCIVACFNIRQWSKAFQEYPINSLWPPKEATGPQFRNPGLDKAVCFFKVLTHAKANNFYILANSDSNEECLPCAIMNFSAALIMMIKMHPIHEI